MHRSRICRLCGVASLVALVAAVAPASGAFASAGASPAANADPAVQWPTPDPAVQWPVPDTTDPGTDGSADPDPAVQLPPLQDPQSSTDDSLPQPDPGDPTSFPPIPDPAQQADPLSGAPVPDSASGNAAPVARGGRCHADPSAEIAAGGVWDGGGHCYIVRDGLTITTPVVVKNATFVTPELRPPSDGHVRPIIRISDTSDVALSDLTLVGANTAGAFHADMVGEAGIDILSSDRVAISDVLTWDTFGDGLTLGFQPGHGPSRDLTVNGLSIGNAGREGVTMGYVEGASLTGVDVLSSAHSAWDFESDLPFVGSGDVVVTDAVGGGGVRMIEWLSGPVTFNTPDLTGGVSLIDEAAQSGQSVSFNGGALLVRDTFHGIPPAGIWVKGPGNLQFTDATIGRRPSAQTPTGPAWLALDGAHLTFDGGSIVPPLGGNDASSTVVFTG